METKTWKLNFTNNEKILILKFIDNTTIKGKNCFIYMDLKNELSKDEINLNKANINLLIQTLDNTEYKGNLIEIVCNIYLKIQNTISEQ